MRLSKKALLCYETKCCIYNCFYCGSCDISGRPLSFCEKTDKVYDALALTVHITLLGIALVGLHRHE